MKESIKKLILHKVLPLLYRLFCVFSKAENTVLFLEIRYEGLSDNLALLKEAYDRQGRLRTRLFCLLTGQGSLASYVVRCIKMAAQISRASVVYVDESSDVLAALPIRKGTCVVQCWHACGAFKRFGHGIPGGLKEEYYGPYSFVTVSSEAMIPFYAQAMNQPEEKVLALGVSRTDRFFDEDFKCRAREKMKKEFPQIDGKKVILFAPTFRGNVARAERAQIPDPAEFKQMLGEGFVVLYKAHPAIREPLTVPDTAKDFWIEATKRGSIEELMCVADCCVTDYSSLIFEYALFERPIFFYTPDLSEYEDERGFYHTIEQLDAGPVCRSGKELADAILTEGSFASGMSPETHDRLIRFRDRFMGSCDGKATERIMKKTQEF